jgi:hypothetical protein
MAHPPLKVGDTVYRVYTGYQTAKVESALVAAASDKQIRLQGTKGAFSWRTTFTPAHADRWGRTEREAWLIYKQELQAEIKQHEQSIADLQVQLRKATIESLEEQDLA